MTLHTPRNLSAHATYFYQDQTLVKEQTEAGGFLRRLYTSTLYWPLRALARTKAAAKLAGWWHDTRWSKRGIEPFIKRHGIDMSQFEIPEGGYASFNDFFYRRLKPGMRTVAKESSTICSPADGKLLVIPHLELQSMFFLKQLPCDLLTLLANPTKAHQYRHGTMLMIRLAPADYHRFHFPFACTPQEPHSIPGRYESVNPISFKQGVQPLTCNARIIIPLQTKDHGLVTMIAVGAMLVGSIKTTYQPNTEYAAGDEAGYFAFGGSTIVLLFEQDTIAPKAHYTAHSIQGFETAVLMGQEVANWATPQGTPT